MFIPDTIIPQSEWLRVIIVDFEEFSVRFVDSKFPKL